MNPALPATLGEVLVLAALLVFLLTSVAALLTTAVISRNGLLYLGSQLSLFFLALYLSRSWSYPLLFSGMLASPVHLGHLAAAGCVFAVAFTLDMALEHRLWRNLKQVNGRPAVPQLLVAVTRLLVYLIAILSVLQFVFSQSITALATLSGAFALVLGLSAQSTLGEMFAGIAIALSKPFRIGDWIKVGDLDEGLVVGMTWRMVVLRHRNHYTFVVTNRTAADQPIRNFSYPSPVVRITDRVYFDEQIDAAVLQPVLAGALTTASGVLASPAPSVLYSGIREFGGEYHLRYYIDDYAERDSIAERVWRSLGEAVRRQGLPISAPRRHVQVTSTPVDLSPERARQERALEERIE